MQASRTASAGGNPRAQATASVPVKASPAPVVSTATTVGAETSQRSPSGPAYRAPDAPSVVTTCGTRVRAAGPSAPASPSFSTRTVTRSSNSAVSGATGDGFNRTGTAALTRVPHVVTTLG